MFWSIYIEMRNDKDSSNAHAPKPNSARRFRYSFFIHRQFFLFSHSTFYFLLWLWLFVHGKITCVQLRRELFVRERVWHEHSTTQPTNEDTREEWNSERCNGTFARASVRDRNWCTTMLYVHKSHIFHLFNCFSFIKYTISFFLALVDARCCKLCAG